MREVSKDLLRLWGIIGGGGKGGGGVARAKAVRSKQYLHEETELIEPLFNRIFVLN